MNPAEKLKTPEVKALLVKGWKTAIPRTIKEELMPGRSGRLRSKKFSL